LGYLEKLKRLMYTPTRFFSNINCFACQDGEKQAVFLLISNEMP